MFRGAQDDTLWDIFERHACSNLVHALQTLTILALLCREACFEKRLLSCLCLAMHMDCWRVEGNVLQDCLASGAVFCSNLRRAPQTPTILALLCREAWQLANCNDVQEHLLLVFHYDT